MELTKQEIKDIIDSIELTIRELDILENPDQYDTDLRDRLFILLKKLT
jgi:hypothetical protein